MTAISADTNNNQNVSTSIECANLISQTPDRFARRPTTIEETGLSTQLLTQLLIKHIQVLNVVTIRELSTLLALSGGIVQSLIDIAKDLSWIENRQSAKSGQMRYALSNIGTNEAELAFSHSGYVGPAPVPLAQYVNIVTQQTSRHTQITKIRMQAKFKDLMFSDELTNAIGPALNSSKPILIYGKPGVGKSYLCRHLNKLFEDDVLIPSAIEIHNNIIQIYDPQVHVLADCTMNDDAESAQFNLDQGYDPRWYLCHRPLLVTGGELTESMLEVNFDPTSKTYKAPLQIKANNGILLLDDLGRQKITPVALFNRWIIPLEERRDFLSLPNGVHFEIPFELILLFSTNLEPAALVDDAFLRRLGYKIEFNPLVLHDYQTLWFNVCSELKLTCTAETFNYLIKNYHLATNKPFLPCFPRDLLSIVSDQIKFNELKPAVDNQLIDTAWKHYFVN
ncbi:MAG: hypothetical protein ACI935_002672 [Moritella dasanensis]|jgi:hypothetical protein